MGPDKDSSTPPKNQDAVRIPRTEGHWRRARHPRSRVCLLKGCGHVFRPEQPLARYCSEACREGARPWRAWKAQRRYRQSPNGKQKRQAQSYRYRERRKERPARETAGVTAARVIPTKLFFLLLRPPGMLCGVRAQPAVAPAAVLWSGLSPRSGARSGTGAALARTAPWPRVEGSLRGKGPSPAAMKTRRYRPDILRSSLPPR